VAKPRTLPFGNFKVYLGDGATPEVFSLPCGFTKESLKISNASSSTVVPDCDDPMAAAWEERAVSAISAQVSGSGVLAMAALATWRAWALSGQSKNIRVMFDDTGANGGGYFQGAAILSDWSSDADRTANGGRTQISVTIDNDGEWTWIDNA
jgi:hypothetical protein